MSYESDLLGTGSFGMKRYKKRQAAVRKDLERVFDVVGVDVAENRAPDECDDETQLRQHHH